MKKILLSILFIIILSSLIFFQIRFISTKGLKVKEYKITNNKIVDEYHGLKIVHFSDLNYGSTFNEKDLIKLVDKINLINPDIVVFTGNILNDIKDKDIIIKHFKNIKSKLGKYAINSNDLKLDDYNYIYNESGFINIDNTYKLIYNKSNQPIIISGIGYDNLDIDIKTREFDTYISNLKNDEIKPIYSILLLNEPDKVDKINLDNYDLILSGKSLNGQINIPYIKQYLLPNGAKKYYENYYKLNNTDFYISSGLGTNKYKYRLFNKPSINFYRITKQ